MSAPSLAVISGRNCYMGARAPVPAVITFYTAINNRDLARRWKATDGHGANEAVMARTLGGVHRGRERHSRNPRADRRWPAQGYVRFLARRCEYPALGGTPDAPSRSKSGRSNRSRRPHPTFNQEQNHEHPDH